MIAFNFITDSFKERVLLFRLIKDLKLPGRHSDDYLLKILTNDYVGIFIGGSKRFSYTLNMDDNYYSSNIYIHLNWSINGVVYKRTYCHLIHLIYSAYKIYQLGSYGDYDVTHFVERLNSFMPRKISQYYIVIKDNKQLEKWENLFHKLSINNENTNKLSTYIPDLCLLITPSYPSYVIHPCLLDVNHIFDDFPLIQEIHDQKEFFKNINLTKSHYSIVDTSQPYIF